MNDLTVFIGRFSPFHIGHADVLSRALSSSKHVLVLIGSSHQSRNVKNPFTWYERGEMISDWADENGINNRLLIQPISDHPYNDQEWIAQVQDIITDVKQTLRVTQKPKLTGANRDESSWYLQAFGDFFDLDLISETKAGFTVNATQIRDMYLTGKHGYEAWLPKTTQEFLTKFDAMTGVL